MNTPGHAEQSTPPSAPEESRAEPSPAQSGDRAILDAIARSDHSGALALLVASHGVVLGRTCMALLGSQRDAEAALEDTLLAALAGLGRAQADGTLRAWLLGSARRRCARLLAERTREREARRSLAAAEPTVDAQRPSGARRARSALEGLRPSEREALVLRVAGELTFREVADACGIDEATARARASRGLKHLRALLAEARP